MGPALNQVDLIAADLEATIAFYRGLGLEIPDSPVCTTTDGSDPPARAPGPC